MGPYQLLASFRDEYHGVQSNWSFCHFFKKMSVADGNEELTFQKYDLS